MIRLDIIICCTQCEINVKNTYIQNSNSENVTNEVIKKLHDCLCQVKESPEVRAGYMMWEEKIFYERLDAKEEGKIEGREEGREEERLRAIRLKLEKGRSKEQIAMELELCVEEVENYIEVIHNM